MSPFVVILITFLVSLLPVLELKGAIPIGLVLASQSGIALSPWVYFAAAYIGSTLPSIIILLYLRPVLDFMLKTKLFAPLATRLKARFDRKSQKVLDKARQRAEKSLVKVQGDGAVLTDEQFEAFQAKHNKRIETMKLLSLFFFVAFPLPLTGIWTGSAIAVFTRSKFMPSLGVIVLGNLVAGLIIMTISLCGLPWFGINFA